MAETVNDMDDWSPSTRRSNHGRLGFSVPRKPISKKSTSSESTGQDRNHNRNHHDSLRSPHSEDQPFIGVEARDQNRERPDVHFETVIYSGNAPNDGAVRPTPPPNAWRPK